MKNIHGNPLFSRYDDPQRTAAIKRMVAEQGRLDRLYQEAIAIVAHAGVSKEEIAMLKRIEKGASLHRRDEAQIQLETHYPIDDGAAVAKMSNPEKRAYLKRIVHENEVTRTTREANGVHVLVGNALKLKITKEAEATWEFFIGALGTKGVGAAASSTREAVLGLELKPKGMSEREWFDQEAARLPGHDPKPFGPRGPFVPKK